MKKKISDKTVAGFYILSLATGSASAVAFILLLNITMISLWDMFEFGSEAHSVVRSVSSYLPWLQFLDIVAYDRHPLIMAVLVVAVIWASVLIIGSKHWRAKFLQTVGFFLTWLLLDTAYCYAVWDSMNIYVILPAVALIVPFLVLKKTRQPEALPKDKLQN